MTAATTAVAADAQRRAFYEAGYVEHSERNRQWRALVARRNADRIEALLREGSLRPTTIVDVGCGDGALLAQLAARGIGESYVAYEIAQAAVDHVRARNIPGLVRAERIDGSTLPDASGVFDLALLNFVLEHTHEPSVLLAQAARVARHVLVSIVLDDTWLARRASHVRGAELAGHIQGFNRSSARALLGGRRVLAVDVRPPSLAAAAFWAQSGPARAHAYAKGLAAHGLHRAAPWGAERLLAASYRALVVSG